MPDGTINPQKAVTADADTVIYFRFWGEADMAGRAALLVPVENDPKRTTASCFSRLSRQGRNHHNFNEHPRSPKVRGEASPHRRICRIDPFIPNRIVIFEQTHVSDPDLGA